MSRVVVVGAGLGGLAVAARLARLRHEVVVVEAADTIGGMLRSVPRDGFTWDSGPTVVTLPAALRDLFLKTGKPLESVLQLEPLELLARCSFADGASVDLPNTGVNDVAAVLDDAFGGGSGAAWRRFHTHAGQIWSTARGSLVEGPLPARRGLLRHPRLARTLSARRTLRDLGSRFFTDPRLRLLVERHATEVGSDPRRAPSWLCVRPYVEHTFRAWTVAGGMRSLVDALHQRALDREAVIRTGVEVVAVTAAGGRVDGVRLGDGEVLPADIVVSAVEPSQLTVNLPSESPMRPAEASASVFTLLLGLRGHSPEMARRSLLFPPDFDDELDAVFGEQARPVGRPTLAVQVSRDPTHAPDGGEAWTVQVTAPRHGSGPGTVAWTEDVANEYAQRLVDELATRGVDVRDRVVATAHRSPADIEKATGVPGGAAYGVALHGPRAAWAPAGNVSSVRGLFLVGGWSHPGGGVPSVTMSAAIVADSVGRA